MSKQGKSSVSQTKKGDLFSRVSHGVVTGKDHQYVHVKNEDGVEWSIGHLIFEAECNIAGQVLSKVKDSTVKCSRTELNQHIMEATRLAVEVTFRKKQDPAAITAAVFDMMVDMETEFKAPTRQQIAKQLKPVLGGEARTLRGRHYGQFNEHGRLKFYDMLAQTWKQIDPRTTESAVIEGVKYVVK